MNYSPTHLSPRKPGYVILIRDYDESTRYQKEVALQKESFDEGPEEKKERMEVPQEFKDKVVQLCAGLDMTPEEEDD